MSLLSFSVRAKNDLREIIRHSLQRWGSEQTSDYLNQIYDACKAVAENPQLGRSCDGLRLGLRCIDQGKHVVFYRKKKEGIVISRILHKNMDVSSKV